MPGHYTARKAVLDMLAAHLPSELAILRIEDDVAFVPTPDPSTGYRLLDYIPMDDVNPRILVSSSEGRTVRADSALATAQVTREYSLTVGVTVFASKTTGIDEEQASIARDVIVDAIVRLLRRHRGLSDVTLIKVADSGDTATGPSELLDKLKRPLSVGQVEVVVSQDEQITPTDPIITTATVDITPLT